MLVSMFNILHLTIDTYCIDHNDHIITYIDARDYNISHVHAKHT